MTIRTQSHERLYNNPQLNEKCCRINDYSWKIYRNAENYATCRTSRVLDRYDIWDRNGNSLNGGFCYDVIYDFVIEEEY